MLTQLRRDGRALAARIAPLNLPEPIVRAIPRCGVIVGAQIAQELRAPLDVMLAAQVGIADRTIGAVALDGERIEVADAIAAIGAGRAAVDAAFAAAVARLESRLAAIRADAPLPVLEGRTVVLVDDAIVSGLTVDVALHSLTRRKVASIVVATPLASDEARDRLAAWTDAWIALESLRQVEAEARHAEAAGRICPPISDEEIRHVLLGAPHPAQADLHRLELDGI